MTRCCRSKSLVAVFSFHFTKILHKWSPSETRSGFSLQVRWRRICWGYPHRCLWTWYILPMAVTERWMSKTGEVSCFATFHPRNWHSKISWLCWSPQPWEIWVQTMWPTNTRNNWKRCWNNIPSRFRHTIWNLCLKENNLMVGLLLLKTFIIFASKLKVILSIFN